MRILKLSIIGLGLMFIAIQFYRPARENPPVSQSENLFTTVQMSAETESILRRACADCHSNETKWPWYSNVAPFSWLVVRDINLGRDEMNFSTWAKMDAHDQSEKFDEICEEVTEKAMPLPIYLVMHPEAVLSDKEIAALCAETDKLRGAGGDQKGTKENGNDRDEKQLR